MVNKHSAADYLSRKERGSEGSSESSSSNDEVQLEAGPELGGEDKARADELKKGSLQTLGSVKKELAHTLEVSRDTSKELGAQEAKLGEIKQSKKKVGEIITEGETQEREIRRAGKLVNFSNRLVDGVKYLFSSKRQKSKELHAKLGKEEARTKEIRGADAAEESSGAEKEAGDAGGGEVKDDVDEELAGTLSYLQRLRKDVKGQNKQIRTQSHMLKEMEVLDKDTSRRSKELTKKINKLE